MQQFTSNTFFYFTFRMSLRSRSPEDSSSILSASGGSLDSMLNHSREDEEIKAVMERRSFAEDDSDLPELSKFYQN